MRAVEFDIEVYGLREALRAMRDYEPELYKQITGTLKERSAPLARKVGQKFPEKPLGRWHTGNERLGKVRLPGYSAEKARGGVKPTVVLKKPSRNQYGILRLEQRDAGGAVYDSAGSKSATRFVTNLDKRLTVKSKRGRTRSRVLYPATMAERDEIERIVEQAIEITNGYVQKAIVSPRIVGTGRGVA